MEMENLETPLISNRDPENDDLDDIPAAAAPGKSGKTSTPGLFMWLLTFSACISGLLFGYDTGVISATLVSIDTSLSNRLLTSFDKSIVTSSTALFALFISPFSSLLADRLGRKRVILFADILFILGAVLQACSYTVFSMVVGRAVVGAAVGAASFVVPLYLAEIAPAAHRGKLVTCNILFVTFGQVVAYIIGWSFAEYGDKHTGWRWMVGLGAVPAGIQTLLIIVMPETPRWLVKAGRSEQARIVIKKIAGKGADATAIADSVLKIIEIEIRQEEDAHASCQTSGRMRLLNGWDELFSVRRNCRALAIASLLQGLQQLCGFNSLMYFSATIFEMLGFSSPTLTSMTVSITNLIFTVIALLIIDRVGRRRILLYSIPIMIIGLLCCAYGFAHINFSSTAATATSEPVEEPMPNRNAALIILISIMLYVAAYAIGLGNVPWMQSELFSLSVRSLGSGVATATNWAANFIVGLTFLPLMDALSPSWTFVMYAIVCLVGVGIISRIYPETSGLSLEDAASLLESDDWGVRRSPHVDAR